MIKILAIGGAVVVVGVVVAVMAYGVSRTFGLQEKCSRNGFSVVGIHGTTLCVDSKTGQLYKPEYLP